MKVKILKSGEVLDVERHELYRIFEKCGLIEILPLAETSRKPANVTWSVNDGSGEQRIVRIEARCSGCHSSTAIFSHPERAKFYHCAWDKVPQDVIAKFEALKNQNAAAGF
jgi:hypothetical protein